MDCARPYFLSSLLLVGACTGEVTGGGGDGTSPELDDPSTSSITGARRLTTIELDAVLFDLLGDDGRMAGRFLPTDFKNPFDNDWDQQTPSAAFSEGAESLARNVTTRLLLDQARLDSVVGCSPSGPGDAACMEEFVRRFGRRALRRPLTDTEVEQYLALQQYGVMASDFYIGVETVLWAFLQDPEFLYRVEIGEPVDGAEGLYRLNSYESVSRLSFLLLGTTPSDALLDAAQEAEDSGASLTTADLRGLAEELLTDGRAKGRAYQFHSQWFGFDVISNAGSLADDMEMESRALIDKVLFDEQRPWIDLLTAAETYVTPDLAAHYGLPAPDGEAGWVDYGNSGRAGILSHASFLTVGARFEDSSPVQRGIAIKTRLLCQPIAPPPPDLNIDDPPAGEGPCKSDRYSVTQAQGCIGCHSQIDPIGWGLERFDRQGAYREQDIYGCDLAEDAMGELPGVGAFSGPAELGTVLAGTEDIRSCLTTQLYRHAVGRSSLLEEDQAMVQILVDAQPEELRYHELLLDLVSTASFVHRKVEE